MLVKHMYVCMYVALSESGRRRAPLAPNQVRKNERKLKKFQSWYKNFRKTPIYTHTYMYMYTHT